ncbi:MAG: hypothetical protein Kow0081_4080 [Candidatus Dojkabacteria bacterium]
MIRRNKEKLTLLKKFFNKREDILDTFVVDVTNDSHITSRVDNEYVYRTRKFGIKKFLKILALVLRDKNICVVTSHLGWIRNEMSKEEISLSLKESDSLMIKFVSNLIISDSRKFFDYKGNLMQL